jgi:hypothetical protein
MSPAKYHCRHTLRPEVRQCLGGTKVPLRIAMQKVAYNDLAVDRASRTALIGLSVGLCDQPALRRSDDPATGRLGSRTG